MINKADYPDIHWLEEEAYAKAVGQANLRMGALLNVFNCYGQNTYIPEVQRQIVAIMEDFGLRVRGVDKPIGEHIHYREPAL